MKRDNKIALILIGFILVFVLTFIFFGGLEAVLEVLNILASTSEEAVENLINFIEGLINSFRNFFG